MLVEIEVPFHEYDNIKKNTKAMSQIKRWIISAIREESLFVPLYVDKDENGSVIEDATGKSKAKIVRCVWSDEKQTKTSAVHADIIAQVIKDIFMEVPHLDLDTADLTKIMEMAWRKGYERAIKNYC